MTMPTRGGDVWVKEEAPVETTKQAGSRLRRPLSIAWKGPATDVGDYHSLAVDQTADRGSCDGFQGLIAVTVNWFRRKGGMPAIVAIRGDARITF